MSLHDDTWLVNMLDRAQAERDEAQAKLARIAAICDRLDADPDPSAWADGRSAVTDAVRAVLTEDEDEDEDEGVL